MNESTLRTRMLLGDDAVERLRRAHVAVFGLGGVGGHAAEALLRAGVGSMTLVDGDRVAPSNLNRQLVALHSTLGLLKAEALKARLLDINPAANIIARSEFFTADTAEHYDFGAYDYVLDAVDMVSAKVLIALRAQAASTPAVSSMGAGNKLDPTRFEVADIYETSVCPLARIMRRELRAAGVQRLTCVYSKEIPQRAQIEQEPETPSAYQKQRSPGSVSFVPPVAGLILAGLIIRELTSR